MKYFIKKSSAFFVLRSPLTTIVMLAFLSSCGAPKSGSSEEKATVLSQSTVLSSSAVVADAPAPTPLPVGQLLCPDGTPPLLDNPVPCPTPIPTPTPVPTPVPTPGPIGGGTPVSNPVQYICSDRRAENSGSTVKTSSVLEVNMVDPDTGAVACRFSQKVREDVLNLKKLDFSVCNNLPKNSYIVRVIDPQARVQKNMLYSADLPLSPVDFLYINHTSSGWVFSTHRFSNSECNRTYSPYQSSNKYGRHGDNDEDDEEINSTNTYSIKPVVVFIIYEKNIRDGKCDENASPLFIDTGVDIYGNMQLSAPLDGVMFNLLGQNQAIPNTPVQISWIHNNRYMFLVLPDSSGHVGGIDQLFGDNTKGPDGQYAANGFDALSKWDANGDSKIDHNDPVFAKLKLWQNKKHDGIAHADELFSLEQLGISSIDLDYDHNFAEHDIY